MTKLLGIVFVLLFCQNSWSQKDSKTYFYQQNDSLEKVILDMEVKFNIKFSFVANTLKDYQISIPKKKYHLVELIQIIESQTNLKIFKISERFYSIQVKDPPYAGKITYLDEIIVEGFVASGINKTSEKVNI